MVEDTFPNRSPDSTLPSFSQVPETVNSPNCSFNTAVSSTSYLDDKCPARQTVYLRSRSSFPINTPTPIKIVTQQPLLTNVLLTNA